MRERVHSCQKMLKSSPKPAWELRAWGAGPASELVTLPSRRQRAEDEESPGGTENVQVTRAGGGSTATANYCAYNPLERGLWVQAGMGGSPGGKWSCVSTGLVLDPLASQHSRGECLLPASKVSPEASKTAHSRSRRGAGRQDTEGEATAAYYPADPDGAPSGHGHRG